MKEMKSFSKRLQGHCNRQGLKHYGSIDGYYVILKNGDSVLFHGDETNFKIDLMLKGWFKK